MPDDLFFSGGAVISDCDLYRYRLFRRWRQEDRGGVLFIMLNPSTADDSVDDPTIRRCTGFTKAWGYGGFEVVNLFAFRATEPDELLNADDPIGPENDEHIRDALAYSDFVVCAWGAHKMAESRAAAVLRIIREQDRVPHCLGVTKSGAPKHPLYIAGDTTPALYSSDNCQEAEQ